MRLVRAFVANRSEAAFSQIVRQHVNMVYSVGLRLTGNAHQAEEIAQAVFIILARKASSLSRKTVLSGWLYQTARLTAANYLRAERRRSAREQEAFMQSLTNEPGPDVWPQIAPLLDEAMAKLGEKDRNAIVLRFFEGKSLHDVGAALGAKEGAAKMRVNRALEKLRKSFSKRGVVLSVAALGAALAANSAAAVPAELAITLSASAAKGATLGASILALVNETLRFMAWAKYKWAIGVGTVAVVVGGTATTKLLLNHQALPPKPIAAILQNDPAAETRVRQPLPPRDPFTPTVHMTLGVPPGAVALQPDGKTVIGSTLSGFFIDEQTGVIGPYRRAAMRFDTNGVLDRTFYCEVNDTGATDPSRAHLEVLADGRTLMSGLLRSVNGVARPGYALLLADGRLDENFQPFRGLTNGWQGYYRTTAMRVATVLGDGSVAVINAIIQGTNTSTTLIAYHLDASGAAIAKPEASLTVPEFGRPSGLLSSLGELGFWARRPVDWTRNERAGRRPGSLYGWPAHDFPFERWTNTPTAGDVAAVLRTLFAETPMELCRYAVRLPHRGFLLAVRTEFTDGSRIGRGRLMRFDENWQPDLAFTNHYEADAGSCITLKLQPDGKFLVAGLVGKFNGQTFPGLLRLEKNGSVDSGFHCEIEGPRFGESWLTDLQQRVMDFALQEDGKIVITGCFTKVNGVERQYLARLNPDGSLDESFRTPFTTWEGLRQYRRVRVQSLAQAKAAPHPGSNRPPDGSSNAPSAAAPASEPPRTVLITSLRMDGGVAVIQFTGDPRQEYILQAGKALDSTNWINLRTNRASANGTGLFRDEYARDHPQRFYRIAVP